MHTTQKYARARQGMGAKSKALAIAMKRKEDYLGARVPKELKDRVIARAGEMGIPVSILIRNILEEAFSGKSLEGDIKNSRFGVDSLKGRSGAAEANRFPMVFAWEQIRLNRAAACAVCDKKLEPRSYAIMGITAPVEERIILCAICKESL